ncbi:hypothetical protein AB0B27_10975 [Micromonospora rifamycinica]|uniref:hypothetical protein n=1 Tax=Micromonospora rifamycinica TaxID=291594 RepID=UPI0034076585
MPLMVTVVFAAWGMMPTGPRSRSADRFQALVAVSAGSGEMVDELSRKHRLSAQTFAGSSTSVDLLLAQVARIDRVVGEYRQRRGLNSEWWASRHRSVRDAALVSGPSDGNADDHRSGDAS